MRKEQKQLSFAKGMIENIKQDLPNEVNPVFDSALWIENMTPNIQRDSLVIRSERSSQFHTIGQNNILEVPLYSKLAQTSLAYNKNNYAHEALRELIVTSASFMHASDPDYGRVYQLFVRRNTMLAGNDLSPHGVDSEATCVIAWVPYIASGAVEHGWREPFTDGEEFPGWYVLGTHTDSTRYGESVIFTTLPRQDMNNSGYPGTYTLTDTAKSKYHACYVWQWWDLHRKREGVNGEQKFWNGLTNSDGSPLDLSLDKYRLWRVRKPSLSIVKDDLVEALALNTYPNGWKTFAGSDPTSKPIQLLFWESPLQTHKGMTHAEYSTFAGNFVNTDTYAIPKVYENPYFNDKRIGFVSSLETLDNDTLYAYGFDSSNRHKKQSEDLLGTLMNSEELVPFPIANTSLGISTTPAWSGTRNWFIYKRNKYLAVFTNTEREMDLWLCSSQTFGGEPEDQQGNVLTPDCKISDPFSSSTTDSNSETNRGGASSVVVGTKLPNYLEASIPRQWVQDEKIPFVLTAVVNGVEVVILKDIYRVSTQNHLFVPSLFSPLAWYRNDTDDMSTADVFAVSEAGYVGAGISGVFELPYKASKRVSLAITDEESADMFMRSEIRHNNYVDSIARNMRVGGQHVFLAPINGWTYFGILISYAAMNVRANKSLYYMYEPFNPTSEIVYRYSGQTPPRYRLNNPAPLYERDTSIESFAHSARNPSEHFWFNAVTGDLSGSDLMNPYIPEIVDGNMVHFGLRIAEDFWEQISSMNISAFNLYVSKPDLQSSILRSIGLIEVQDVPNGLYCKPAVTKDNIKSSQGFALVKSFVIEGEGTTTGHWENYKGSPLSTNAWKRSGGHIWAVPQSASGSAYSAIPTFVDHCTPYTLDDTNSWTPDFMLWDYPVLGKSLLLGGSGNYWQGLGAGLVAVIKGRTFLAQIPGEVGVVRYSVVQAGVAAQDLFYEEEKMRIGHNEHTALIEYREQLWIFSRVDNYRIQMPNVYDVATWEFLDNVAMGTFDQRTVAVTPYGVAYCNESGVWMSDGRLPTNIAAPVLPSYLKLTRDAQDSAGLPGYSPELAYIGEFVDSSGNVLRVHNNEQGVNGYLEAVYDSNKDELVINTPLFSWDGVRWKAVREYRMVYSYPNQNWRVESYDVPDTEVA